MLDSRRPVGATLVVALLPTIALRKAVTLTQSFSIPQSRRTRLTPRHRYRIVHIVYGGHTDASPLIV